MTASMGRVKWFTSTEVTQVNKLERGYNVILSNGLSVLADALLLTTGFTLFNASKKEEYGYGIYDRVITNADLEDWFSGIPVPAVDNPRRIGFVHCVGSRDEKVGNRYCSKVCCATAVKQACEIKQQFGQPLLLQSMLRHGRQAGLRDQAAVSGCCSILFLYGPPYVRTRIRGHVSRSAEEIRRDLRQGPCFGSLRGQGRPPLRQGGGHALR